MEYAVDIIYEASMWHKTEWMAHQMRLELTRLGLLVKLANRYTTRGAQCSWYEVIESMGKYFEDGIIQWIDKNERIF